jgi:predicted nuclease of restriction endonuclease-like RecB superfamily
MCEVHQGGKEGVELILDGPLSLFSATQKYGLQLALFLPVVLLCRDFDVVAELRWGAKRMEKRFVITAADRLVSHVAETGMYLPPEMKMFVDLFRKKITDWQISDEADVFPLGDGFWVPDFRLTHVLTGKPIFLEVLGFWRRASAEKHLERLRKHCAQQFLLAVSDQLKVDDAELEGLPAGIHRFKQMPLPDEIARLADELVQGGPYAARVGRSRSGLD